MEVLSKLELHLLLAVPFERWVQTGLESGTQPPPLIATGLEKCKLNLQKLLTVIRANWIGSQAHVPNQDR